MKRNYLSIIAMVFLATILFSGCEKEKLIDGFSSKEDPIKAKEGVLIFQSSTEFEDYVKNEKSVPIETLQLWEDNLGFKSQHRIYKEIVEAENKLLEPYENMTEEELAAIDFSNMHSDTYFKYLQSGLIKEYTDEDGTYAVLNMCMPSYSVVANEKGFFMIGDTLFQVTATQYKYMYPADLSKREQLDNTTSSAEKESIFVIDMKQKIVSKGTGAWQVENSNSTKKNVMQIFWTNLPANSTPNARLVALDVTLYTYKKPKGIPGWSSTNGDLYVYVSYTITYNTVYNNYSQTINNSSYYLYASKLTPVISLGAPNVSYNWATKLAQSSGLTGCNLSNVTIRGIGPSGSGGMTLTWTNSYLN